MRDRSHIRSRRRAAVVQALHQPTFTTEGPQLYHRAYIHNQPYAKPGPYKTKLGPVAEVLFRSWLLGNRVPFNPVAKVADYDMRGFFRASHAAPHHLGDHFPDTFKTPYDTSFSSESRYATPNNPFVWVGNSLVNRHTGQLVFRSRR